MGQAELRRYQQEEENVSTDGSNGTGVVADKKANDNKRYRRSKEQLKRIKQGHDCLDCCSIEEWNRVSGDKK